ncbi:Hypothetical protein Eab7_2823 [Exiguobacterium antarcticum B7]|nr:Hypothetical protein Eab7_2823 [Exiguobacterium antarcticum B7]
MFDIFFPQKDTAYKINHTHLHPINQSFWMIQKKAPVFRVLSLSE